MTKMRLFLVFKATFRLPFRLVLWLIMAAIAQADDTNVTKYLISPQDVLIVDVFGEKELSREFRVEANGDITYPLLQSVKVNGLTTAEVEVVLKERLGKDFLVDPQVTVTVKEYRRRVITVMGEVMKPGAFDLPGEQKWTILDAIGQAGGPTKGANKKRIQFTRRGRTQEYRLDDLKKTSDPAKIIWLEPGDNINIPQTVW
jgi:protein involved in polysaccharide export with SLBB domain